MGQYTNACGLVPADPELSRARVARLPNIFKVATTAEEGTFVYDRLVAYMLFAHGLSIRQRPPHVVRTCSSHVELKILAVCCERLSYDGTCVGVYGYRHLVCKINCTFDGW